MDDTTRECFAAFDSEVRRAYTWAYTAAVARAAAPVPPDATGALASASLDAVLPPLASPGPGTPRRARDSHRSPACFGRTLPYSSRCLHAPSKTTPPLPPGAAAAAATEAALEEALASGALCVNVRDWAVLDVDVEPYIALMLRATLGDFEAVTYRTLDDFRELHATVGRVVDTRGAEHGQRIAFPAHLSALARAALAPRPLRSKAPRFECACRRRTGLERPHAGSAAPTAAPGGAGATCAVGAGATPRPACHCSCGYCCWGAAAAELLGVRLRSYLVAVCKYALSPAVLRWLGFNLDCVSLASRTYGPGSSSSIATDTLSAPAAAAVALRTLYGRTVAAVDRAARLPAFRVHSQAAAYFNTLDEGLRWWVVAEHVRRGSVCATPSAASSASAAAAAAAATTTTSSSSSSLSSPWLPGATPTTPLSREQRREREGLKAALDAGVRDAAQRCVAATRDRLAAFAQTHAGAAAAAQCHARVLAPLTAHAVAPWLARSGRAAAAQGVARVVCVLLERHVLTRAAMEPLAAADAQLAQFAAACVRGGAAGKCALAAVVLARTRDAARSAVAASTHAFAADVAAHLHAARTRAALRPLLRADDSGSGPRTVAAALACVPTLVRAALHVALADAPVVAAPTAPVARGPAAPMPAFAAAFAAAVRIVRGAAPAAHHCVLEAQRTPLVQAWRALRSTLRTVAWRAGYILEKSLIAQYVQQSAVLKGASSPVPADTSSSTQPPQAQPQAAATDAAATAPSVTSMATTATMTATAATTTYCSGSAEGLGTEDSLAGSICSGSRGTPAGAGTGTGARTAGEGVPAVATPHPYALGFAMDSVQRHLHALGDATAAACWGAVVDLAQQHRGHAVGARRRARRRARVRALLRAPQGAARAHHRVHARALRRRRPRARRRRGPRAREPRRPHAARRGRTRARRRRRRAPARRHARRRRRARARTRRAPRL